jgi:Family of unknown function (DUF5681)
MSSRWQKGVSGNPGGRPKGAVNKTTAAVREAILAAFDEKKFLEWMATHQTEYYQLVSRLMPKDMVIRTISRFEDLMPEELSSLEEQLRAELELRKKEGLN